MTEQNGGVAGTEAVRCEVCGPGMKCAVMSWAMPMVVAVMVYIGLRHPVLNIFNMIFVAFGVMATTRTVLAVRTGSECGFGRHLAVGVVLNALALTLIGVYYFTGFDPLHIRP